MDVPQAVLEWDRGTLGAECERAESVRAGVDAYLGRAAFAASGDVIVSVRLARVNEGGVSRVVATVQQRDAGGKLWGERAVSGDGDCASLDEPLTLVVALMVDAPVRPPGEEPPPPEPEPPPSRAPLATPAQTQEASGEIETAPSLALLDAPRPHAAFLALGAVSMGASPSVGAGVTFVAALRPRGPLGFGVSGMALVPERQALGVGSATVSFLSLRGELCPVQSLRDDGWYSACAGFGAARLHLKPRDLLEAKSHTELCWMPALAVRGGFRVGARWLLAGGVDAAFPLGADRYVYRDAEGAPHNAFELSRLVVTASAGLGLLVD
jgi:hypothetical protein